MMEITEHRAGARMVRRSTALASGIIFAALAIGSHQRAIAQSIAWSDEFDAGGAPDPAVWTHDLGANGWGNNELQEYTDDPANARVEDGVLVIRALAASAGAPFTSARIRTQDKLMFRYGTLEARIAVPDLADGLWPAFWTLGSRFVEVGWPACGELDILEMGHVSAIADGTVNRRVGSAAHWQSGGNYAGYALFHDAPQRLDGGFHLFRLEWTPETVATFVDGEPVWTMDIGPDACGDCGAFHEPHFIILNLAVGGNYTQVFDAEGVTATLPAEMKVDYVRLYDNGHTEVSGSAAPQR